MLNELLRNKIRDVSGTNSYIRGLAYFDEGRVSWRDSDEGLQASVRGTRKYDVYLWIEDDELQYECNCPIRQDEDFCKHCVAVALAWLAAPGGEADSPSDLKAISRKTKRENATGAAIRAHLATLDSAVLVDLLVEASETDDRLRERLALQAGDDDSISGAAKAWKNALAQATHARHFVDWRAMPDFSQRIAELLDRLETWGTSVSAALVIELAEYAVDRVEDANQHCDDSNGEMGDLLTRIGGIHLTACVAARPDPVALAKRLFKFELTGEWDTFAHSAQRYAGVLGETGLAVYRTLAEKEWAKVPALVSETKREEKWLGTRFRITQIMESLARQTADVDALVVVLERDLSSSWNFLRIAEAYRTAQFPDKALMWAERGLAAFVKHPDTRLQDFLIDEYLRRGRSDEALALCWQQFHDQPALETYRKLRAAANPLQVWPAWRDKALAFLRADITKDFTARASSRYGRAAAPDQSRLVEILLWEGDVEAAWLTAKSGLCSEVLWHALADRRAGEHPDDSLAIYQRQVLITVAQTNNRAYAQAIAMLRELRPLKVQTHGQQAFDRYISELRAATKAKRNFIKLLNSFVDKKL